jgi:hypothetical protein
MLLPVYLTLSLLWLTEGHRVKGLPRLASHVRVRGGSRQGKSEGQVKGKADCRFKKSKILEDLCKVIAKLSSVVSLSNVAFFILSSK